MTAVPAAVPGPAGACAPSARSHRQGQEEGAFEQTLQSLLERSLGGLAASAASPSSANASMLNEHGFFDDAPPHATNATEPAAAAAPVAAIRSTDDGPWRASNSTMLPAAVPPTVVEASDGTTTRRDATSTSTDPLIGRPASDATGPGDGPHPSHPSHAAAAGLDLRPASSGVARRLDPAARPVAADGASRTAAPNDARLALATRIDGAEVAVTVRAHGMDAEGGEALRDEVAALLARHGLVLGGWRINGRASAGRANGRG